MSPFCRFPNPIEGPMFGLMSRCVLFTQVPNSILISHQSGFRKNQSCEAALQLTLGKFKNEIDKNKYVVAVFLDLRKAFETLD
ncbi:hypothetical protein NQ317_008338 [Molorchus minor]|uniref:Reverse transcriptase domain-containing protein n=1 Tax=Molorchus minor TaxID=1323400 RepID=A0ABQ9JTE7_9CUCU|nr:hypothetical protein NQ317_008338 [Molorchus minor]